MKNLVRVDCRLELRRITVNSADMNRLRNEKLSPEERKRLAQNALRHRWKNTTKAERQEFKKKRREAKAMKKSTKEETTAPAKAVAKKNAKGKEKAEGKAKKEGPNRTQIRVLQVRAKANSDGLNRKSISEKAAADLAGLTGVLGPLDPVKREYNDTHYCPTLITLGMIKGGKFADGENRSEVRYSITEKGRKFVAELAKKD